MPHDLGKMLMSMGALLVLVGAALHFGGRWFHLGKLPGDLSWSSGSFHVYFPLATSIIVSIVLTVLLNLFWRR